MAFSGTRRLVGLGFGAIQAGLFVYEAQRSGDYAPPLVVDVRADLVAALRSAEGRFRVNIAHADHVAVADLGSVEVADSGVPADRARIVTAIAQADEVTSALPSVAFYRTDSPTSPHRLLAEGLALRTRIEPLLVLCAENHRNAAALLREAVLAVLPAADRPRAAACVRWVDTVIGKMSGVIDDAAEVAARGLATITPTLPAAFLVEAFDRILVSRADPGGGRTAVRPGMPVLREVDDLTPFEDAKLLGHNAIHALAGFLGRDLDLRLVAGLTAVPGCMAFLRSAFIEESGRTLIARHGGSDPLFTPSGYTAFADDLLQRMVNPWLADTVERAARDPGRKLAWDDRLIGLMRLAQTEGVPTPRVALGVAVGLDILAPRATPREQQVVLAGLWPDDADPAEAAEVQRRVAAAIADREVWRREGFDALTG
jgi:mannitol-1-phosphate/altronate dehydrogenase